MSFFSRWAEKWMDSLETRNPEAVYEAAIRQQKEAIGANKDVLTSAIVRRNELSNKLEALSKDLQRVMIDLPTAVDNGDDESALVLIQQKDDLVTQLETLTGQLDQANNDVAGAKTSLQAAKDNLAKLTKEKTQAIAELQVAQAKIAVQEANSGFSDDSTARGLTSVRESINRMEAQANEGYLDSEGHSIRGKVEAMEERSAEARARAELSRMKAGRGATRSDDDEDDQASSKKRSL